MEPSRAAGPRDLAPRLVRPSPGVYNGGVKPRDSHSIRDRINENTAAMKVIILVACLCYAAADVSHLQSPEAGAQILEQDQDVNFDGSFHWEFKSDNGIVESAHGSLQNQQGEQPAQVVQGEASWTAPNGEKQSFTYTADETGYHPQGDILPTPPPIPEDILKALKYIQEHPSKEDQQRK